MLSDSGDTIWFRWDLAALWYNPLPQQWERAANHYYNSYPENTKSLSVEPKP
jgi:hypothetical protein